MAAASLSSPIRDMTIATGSRRRASAHQHAASFNRQTVAEAAIKSVVRSVGSSVGRAIVEASSAA